MSKLAHDFFVAGRWRNKQAIEEVVQAIRGSGKTVYCFLENLHEKELHTADTEAAAVDFEARTQDDPVVCQVFQMDLAAQKQSTNFLLVLPAGNSGHIEAGLSYGLGKKCYAVGPVEKTDSLYCIFDKIFPDTAALKAWLASNKDHDDVFTKENT